MRVFFPILTSTHPTSIQIYETTIFVNRTGRYFVVSGSKVEIRPGNSLPLANIPVGTMIHNIELKEGRGGQMVRSAGVAAQLLAKEGEYAHVRLPSGEVRLVRQGCYATVGQVRNLDHGNIKLGKPGRKRNVGIRPTVL